MRPLQRGERFDAENTAKAVKSLLVFLAQHLVFIFSLVRAVYWSIVNLSLQ